MKYAPQLFLTIACTLALTLAQPAPAWAKKAKAHKPRQRVESTGPTYSKRDDAMAFASEVAQRNELDAKSLRKTVGQARLNKTVQQLMSPAPAGFQKNWQVYRSRFIEPKRIDAGVRFWNENEATLQRAEQAYGVPASIVVGILGVETLYGRDTGQFRVLDALTTLAFDFPATHPRAKERQKYFRAELEQFLLMTSHANTDALAYKGSYAGAMGWPQFMPGSWAKFAVDFDGDGKIDLFQSTPDIVGSVANYFKQYGWQTGLPTHFEARFADSQTLEQRAQLLAPDILPTFNPAQLQALGMALDTRVPSQGGKLALVELKNGNAEPQYLLGTDNFYVITRYNWSAYYAMAVIELGQAVQQARSTPATPKNP